MKRRLVAWYAGLLVCLPAGFRAEFGAEMEQVFAGRVDEMGNRGPGTMVRLFAAEVLALPGLWLLARRREKRLVMTDDVQRDTGSGRPAPWGGAQASWAETLAAILPLVTFMILTRLAGPVQHLFWTLDSTFLDQLHRLLWTDTMRGAPVPLAFYVLLLAGLLVAWLKEFPRWSYPYLGWLLVILIAGIDIPRPGDPFPWLAWGPFLLTMLLAIALRPSRAPLRALARGWRRDWTLSAFAVLGIVQFLVWASVDKMPGPRELGQFLPMATLVVGALGYMRTRRRTSAVAALLGAIVLSVGLSATGYGALGQEVPKPVTTGPVDGASMTAWAMLLAILMVPALLSAILNRFFPDHTTR